MMVNFCSLIQKRIVGYLDWVKEANSHIYSFQSLWTLL